MSDNIHSQYDFFQAVQLDAEGNLLVSIVNFTGGTSGGTVSGDTRTINAYLSGTTVHFDRNDLSNAYSVDLSPIAGFGGNLDGSTAFSIPIDLNIDGGGA